MDQGKENLKVKVPHIEMNLIRIMTELYILLLLEDYKIKHKYFHYKIMISLELG